VALTHLTKHGRLDAIRTLHPKERIYPFLEYFRNAYERRADLTSNPSH
jgi:hypothetical protein